MAISIRPLPRRPTVFPPGLEISPLGILWCLPEAEKEGEALGFVTVLELLHALWGFLEKDSAGLGPKAACKKPTGSGWEDWASSAPSAFP